MGPTKPEAQTSHLSPHNLPSPHHRQPPLHTYMCSNYSRREWFLSKQKCHGWRELICELFHFAKVAPLDSLGWKTELFLTKPDFKGSEIGFLSKNCLDWVRFGWGVELRWQPALKRSGRARKLRCCCGTEGVGGLVPL